MSTSASINRARARAESLFLAFANGVGIFEHQVTSKFLIADGQAPPCDNLPHVFIV
jgi:hypothetical protein